MCNKYYELEYINEGYSPIQKVRNSCSSDNCSSGCGGGCHYDCGLLHVEEIAKHFVHMNV